MVPGSAHALRRRRGRLAPDISKIPPACGRIFFQLSRRGGGLVHPRAGALPETMALSRRWRGGDERLGELAASGERLHRRFTLPVEFVIPLEIRSSFFHRLAIRPGRAHSISQRVLDV